MKQRNMKCLNLIKRYREQLILYIAVPFLLFLIIDMLGLKSIPKGLVHCITHPLMYLANVSIIIFTLSLSLLSRKRMFYYIFIQSVWLILGIVNFALLNTRVTPFTAMDILNIDSALKVMDKYFTAFTFALLIIAIAGLVIGWIFLFVKSPYKKSRVRYGKSLLLIAAAALTMAGNIALGNASGNLSLKFPELSAAYRQYGFVYCFCNSVFNSGVSKPENYSQNEINKIKSDGNATDETKKTDPNAATDLSKVKTPNIIIVQLESFFDITRCNDMNFSEDPLPNFHKYMKQCASGRLSMPVVGAGTVNSEFEVLTGLNIDNFGPGEYPYKTILRKMTCESIPYNLKDLGYTSHAIHDNTGQFYGRNKVFSNLGFDDFTSVEYMNLNEKTDYTKMGWAKDKCLTEYVMKALNSTKGSDFVYTISVQGHGSYPDDKNDGDQIKVTSKKGAEIDETLLKQREYYTNQIHEMDQFVADLIHEIERRNEESIVVFYGDHLPSLSFKDEELKQGNIYDTDYFIWENLKDVSYSNQNMQAYELESKILKPLNIKNGLVNQYHQNNQKKNEKEYLNGLQNLQYDIFNGDFLAYGGENPYQPTNLKMGIDEIKITNICKDKAKNESVTTSDQQDEKETANKPSYVLVKGKNFTKYSVVYVNDVAFDTEFIDSKTLRISDPDLKGLDSFVVKQVQNAEEPLSASSEMLYYGDN